MKIVKVMVIGLLSNILLANFAFGQIEVSGSANISITVLKALEISQVKGDLNFGDFVQTNVAAKIERTPEHGILFEVTGSPGRNVVVDYKNTFLHLSGSNSSAFVENGISFTPEVKTTFSNSSYLNPRNVANGSSLELSTEKDSGVLYLWVGGKMDINRDLLSGGYNGDFAITVSY